ncbi:hypothetical protein ACJMK2_004075 [Sinanodonta woodiana]|uniref:Uncharacterized protein n=1 Tax=Sinanodonta woodiana TaxID=1069815 RepID=A0ABD3Y040_SINWO
MCIIDDNEVAIAMPHKKTVQFLSIIDHSIRDHSISDLPNRDHSIRDTETLTTKYRCCGIDAVSVEEIVVSGPCGDTYSGTCYWSLITRNGNVKLHHTFECQQTNNAYAALDRSKSRVYISVSGSNAVYCFGLTDGTRYFVYSSNDLVFPLGVSVDREDNIYVVGYMSNNIHKVSSIGDTLQVITSGVPQNPRGISFEYSGHHFVITNGSHANRKLHCFVCK